jgi:RNA polymerase sigma factor (sigma-70 family)
MILQLSGDPNRLITDPNDLAACLTPEVLENCRDFVYRYVRRRLQAHDDAEDVTQRVMMRAWASRDWFRANGRSPVRAWVCRIAQRQISSWIRDNARHVGHERWNARDDDELASGYDLEREVILADEAKRIYGVAVGISATYGPTFMAHYRDQLTESEIAARESCNVKTIKTRLFRARKQVRKALGIEVGAL